MRDVMLAQDCYTTD